MKDYLATVLGTGMYVDDTFVIIKKSNLSEFFTCVNAVESFVQLIM